MNVSANARIDFRAMNSAIGVIVDGADAAGTGAHEVMTWFAEWERRFSRFQPTSELSRVNSDPAECVPISQPLFEVLSAALYAAHVTGGLVTPTVLEALEHAGYSRSFERLDANSRQATTTPARPCASAQVLRLQRTPMTLTRPSGLRLDLGGIAKGWAADRAAARLRGLGAVLIDAGGDVAISGPRADGSPWPIAVASPFPDDDEPLGLLLLASGGVATSGIDRRRWRQNGVWHHHLVDPRTGASAVTDVVTATVVAPSASEAEAAAKAVLILGSEAGLAWLEGQPAYAGLVVRQDGELRRSSRLTSFTTDTYAHG